MKKMLAKIENICYINNMETKNCKLEKLLICFEIGALLAVVTLIVINL